jgi:hypothetical protein
MKKRMKIDSKKFNNFQFFSISNENFALKNKITMQKFPRYPWENKRATFFFTIQTRNSEKKFCYEKK